VYLARRDEWNTSMNEPEFNEKVLRPTMCPFCKSRSVDTLARQITVRTLWRCRKCESTWAIDKLTAARLNRRM